MKRSPAQTQPTNDAENVSEDPRYLSREEREEIKKRKKRRARITSVFLIVLLLCAAGGFWGYKHVTGFDTITTSEGIALLEKGTDVAERAEMTDGTQWVKIWLKKPTTSMDAKGKKHDVGTRVTFQYAEPQAEKISDLIEKADYPRGWNAIRPTGSLLESILTVAIPMLIVVAFFAFILSRSDMGGVKMRNVKDKGSEETPSITFADVAGADEAVEELREVVQFLTSPKKFADVGAKIPRGVLLYGPPGTGKTLLARAVAGEAGVPFYSISASEFVEMFVGVGASRVRKLFSKAKENAPAIVFVDEIDAVGRGRGNGIGGGNDEREQTLNQLLVELDGFDERESVILIAATNRPDILDPALLRPGRFDRQIAVEAPDMAGREAIVAVHSRKKPLASDVDAGAIARRTPGFTGADLANVMNEAALLTARRDREKIGMEEIDEAIDRVMAGPQKTSRMMDEEDRKLTAYHEAGHALVAAALRHSDPVTKVTILPRGRALGYTMVMPENDRYSTTRNRLLDQLAYALGGRAAEEVTRSDITTGASNDIQKATRTARLMVSEYGMSVNLGPVRWVNDVMPGEESAHVSQNISPAAQEKIDAEVAALLENAYREARHIITTNRVILDTLAERLLEKETLLENELAEIFADVWKLPERASSDTQEPHV